MRVPAGGASALSEGASHHRMADYQPLDAAPSEFAEDEYVARRAATRQIHEPRAKPSRRTSGMLLVRRFLKV